MIEQIEDYFRFNPHSHIRSDYAYLFKWRQRMGFNPHSHIRSDHTKLFGIYGLVVSIHTPT